MCLRAARSRRARLPVALAPVTARSCDGQSAALPGRLNTARRIAGKSSCRPLRSATSPSTRRTMAESAAMTIRTVASTYGGLPARKSLGQPTITAIGVGFCGTSGAKETPARAMVMQCVSDGVSRTESVRYIPGFDRHELGRAKGLTSAVAAWLRARLASQTGVAVLRISATLTL
jgi:hypothetical protein